MLWNKHKVSPVIADFLKTRDTAVHIELYAGSMSVSAECLRSPDVVTSLEVIEHLYPDVLENVPYNVFGFMQPKLAIFSTPNADFNVHFGTMSHSNGFRNADHKFEWTREQFQNWAINITERFPNYCVTFFGVGAAPYGYEYRGPVTQFALFVRRDIRNLPLVSELTVEPSVNDTNFTQVHTAEFPQRIDERSLEEKIIDEANYTLNQYKYRRLCHDEEREVYLVPFDKILLAVEEYTTSANVLRNLLLEKGYVIENNCIIVKEENHRRYTSYSLGSDSECDMYEDENEEQDYDPFYDYSYDNPIVDREEECWDSDS